MRGRSWVRALHSAALLSLCSRAVLAASDDELTKAGIQVVTEAEAGLVELATVVGSRPPARPEERLAAGDMYLRNRDFARAIVSFEQVVELFRQGKANQASHADALNSLGEAYFRTEQLLSARRVFHELAELATKESYAEYGGRALGRLVDVALRTGRLEQLDFVFERISALAKDDESGALAYARAKANFARRNYPEAERAVQQLPEASPLQAQAGYLLGVIYLNQTLAGDVASAEDKAKVPEKSQRFAKPILQFQKVTRISAKTDEQCTLSPWWRRPG
jgi:tetratricopeptide (TPR) repeat protein